MTHELSITIEHNKLYQWLCHVGHTSILIPSWTADAIQALIDERDALRAEVDTEKSNYSKEAAENDRLRVEVDRHRSERDALQAQVERLTAANQDPPRFTATVRGNVVSFCDHGDGGWYGKAPCNSVGRAEALAAQINGAHMSAGGWRVDVEAGLTASKARIAELEAEIKVHTAWPSCCTQATPRHNYMTRDIRPSSCPACAAMTQHKSVTPKSTDETIKLIIDISSELANKLTSGMLLLSAHDSDIVLDLMCCAAKESIIDKDNNE